MDNFDFLNPKGASNSDDDQFLSIFSNVSVSMPVQHSPPPSSAPPYGAVGGAVGGAPPGLSTPRANTPPRPPGLSPGIRPQLPPILVYQWSLVLVLYLTILRKLLLLKFQIVMYLCKNM